jgi:AcrR family transcriptional regulator
MAAQRLSREESQALTRARLVEAARQVFAEKGFYGATVEEVTERAGFTRGAFYSNFADKNNLFLAALEAHIEIQVDEVSGMIRQAATPEAFLAAIRDRGTQRPLDRGWHMLRAEFQAHALRDPNVRPRLADQQRRERRAYARAVKAVFDSMGISPPAPPEQLALILQSLDEWTSYAHAIDPDNVPQSAYFDSLELLFQAGVALAIQRSSRPPTTTRSSSDSPRRSTRARKRRRSSPG